MFPRNETTDGRRFADASEPPTDLPMPNLAHSENTRVLLKEETRRIIGFAFEVLNELGHGLYEKIYENALVVDFQLNGIPYQQLSEDYRTSRRFDPQFQTSKAGI